MEKGAGGFACWRSSRFPSRTNFPFDSRTSREHNLESSAIGELGIALNRFSNDVNERRIDISVYALAYSRHQFHTCKRDVSAAAEFTLVV